MKDYSDIISLPHHVSPKRPRMSCRDRAAQFSPFSALSGYEAAIAETGRITEERARLDECRKRELDSKLQELKNGDFVSSVSISYFIPDSRKDGGSYANTKGKIIKIDAYKREILLNNGIKVQMDDIVDITIIKS